MADYNKPLPSPTPISAPFWQSAHEHDLKVQRCRPNQHYYFYPRKRCPYCHTEDVDWVPVSGNGRVYTYTLVYRAANPAFQEAVPYVFAIVELDESPNLRMYTNVEDVAIESVRCEMPVRVKYDDVTDDVTLVKFVPA